MMKISEKEARDILVERISEAHYTEIEQLLGYPITGAMVEDGLENRIRRTLALLPEEEVLKYELKYLDRLPEERTADLEPGFICNAYYAFHRARLIVSKPDRIIKETPCFYYTENKRRITKAELGEASMKSDTAYPYIEVDMLNATNAQLIDAISGWFSKMSNVIKNKEA